MPCSLTLSGGSGPVRTRPDPYAPEGPYGQQSPEGPVRSDGQDPSLDSE